MHIHKSITKTGQHAVSMIELLVVIAVLAILIALLFPVLQKMSKRSADAACMHNLKTLGVGMFAYAAENNGRLPEIKNAKDDKGIIINRLSGHQWDVQIATYLQIDLTKVGGARTPFICPGGEIYSNPSTPLGRNLSYGYNVRVGSDPEVVDDDRSLLLPAIERPSELVVIADRELTPGSNENYVTLGGSSSAIFISEQPGRLQYLPYGRHGSEHIHILFADGHVAPRRKLGAASGSLSENMPRNVRWRNNGPLSPDPD